MTRKSAVLGAVVAVAVGTWAAPIQAQGGPGMRGAGGPNMGGSIALALEHQEELGLTGEQVSQLQEMKGILEGEVAPLAEEMKALREQIRSGEVDRAEGLRRMEALRGEIITASAPLRGRVAEIFTVAQHEQLQGLVRQGRPGLGRGAMQGPGRGRAAPGALRGGRGAGMGQGMPGRGFPGGGVERGMRQGLPGANPMGPRPRGPGYRRGIGG